MPFLFGSLEPVFHIPYYFRRVLDESYSAGRFYQCLPTLLNTNPYADFPSFGGFANDRPGRRIKRKDTAPKLYTITRAEIEIKSISQKLPDNITLPNDIGYIRLSSFISRNAAKEFSDILVNSKDKKGFIVDLRSNPGGLLSNAIYISDMFLDGGVIVSTVDRDGYKETQRAAKGMVTDKPLIVLISAKVLFRKLTNCRMNPDLI